MRYFSQSLHFLVNIALCRRFVKHPAKQGLHKAVGRQLPGVEGLVEVIAVASYLDEQTAGGEVLIIKR